ncbi:MAG: hypothetical protein HYY13_10110 [Nitrospirae bacterium]|nr:hypothetical protein [Nitrospirota bacterium]
MVTGSRARFVEAVGRLMAAWSFKEAYGRIWAYLYLSPGPRPAREVSRDLSINRGQLSLLLREMDQWGAIHRFHVPDRSGVVYRAEERLWKMIRRVFRDRERAEVERAFEVFRTCQADLAKGASLTDRMAARKVRRLTFLSAWALEFLERATAERPSFRVVRLFWRIQNALMA